MLSSPRISVLNSLVSTIQKREIAESSNLIFRTATGLQRFSLSFVRLVYPRVNSNFYLKHFFMRILLKEVQWKNEVDFILKCHIRDFRILREIQYVSKISYLQKISLEKAKFYRIMLQLLSKVV